MRIRISTTGMGKIVTGLVILLALAADVRSQTPEELIRLVKAKLEKVNDYVAMGKMKTNVLFIKAPIANVKVYFKKPNRLKIDNEKGISFIPRGSVNINLGNIFSNTDTYNIIDVGTEKKSGLRIIKLLPADDAADVVLSTLYIDASHGVIRKATTTTRESGTYELEMTYGKYADYGLADKVIFSFNTKDYKLPKGITFDYDDGDTKSPPPDKEKGKKGRVEITYSSYTINQGVADSVFR